MFDTLVTRRWITPEHVFLEAALRLARAGLWTADIAGWQDRRVHAERACRDAPGVEEVSLDQIYQKLAVDCRWTASQAEQARDIELACELACIRPLAPGARLLADAAAAGLRTAIVTDTYFPPETIVQLLERCGIDPAASTVFVSCQHGATKRTGRLFSVVAQEAGVQPTRIRHAGDNFDSDVLAAARAGVQPRFFTEGALTRREAVLWSSTDFPTIMRSALAGSARCVRLSRAGLTPHGRAVWETSAGVSGPLLFGFVLWVLQQAREQGLTRLYFVARDGQVLLRIASAITARLGWDIECRYLYGSRQAWHLPALDQLDEPALNWLLDGSTARSLREIFGRVAIEIEDIAEEIAALGVGPAQWDAPITDEPATRALLQSPAIAQRILLRAAEIREPAEGYFRQEGLLDGATVAIVDIGWHGRLQRSLTRVLNHAAPGTEVRGFYLGLSSKPADLRAADLCSYLDISDASATASWRINPPLLEIFCAADHGSVIGYRSDAGKFAPVMRQPENGMAMKWGLELQQEAIATLAAELSDAVATLSATVVEWVDLLRAASGQVLLDFKEHPTREEADALGSFYHAEHQTHSAMLEFAPPVTAREAVHMLSALHSPAHPSYWLEASFKRRGGVLLGAAFNARLALLEQARHLRKRFSSR